MQRPPDPRPLLAPALDALLADVIARTDELTGIDASAVLVVAQGAHGRAAASVRSLLDAAHRVEVEGKVRAIEISLRPPFFLDGDATARLTTLVHELLHIDPARPGELLDAHKHEARSHAEHEAHARSLAQRWLDAADPAQLAPLGHDGEVWMRAWKHRPVPDADQQSYGDDDVFLTPVRLVTPASRRTSWG